MHGLKARNKIAFQSTNFSIKESYGNSNTVKPDLPDPRKGKTEFREYDKGKKKSSACNREFLGKVCAVAAFSKKWRKNVGRF